MVHSVCLCDNGGGRGATDAGELSTCHFSFRQSSSSVLRKAELDFDAIESSYQCEPITATHDKLCQTKYLGQDKKCNVIIEDGSQLKLDRMENKRDCVLSKPVTGRLLTVLCCLLTTILLTLVKMLDIHVTSVLVSRNVCQLLMLTTYNCWAISCFRKAFKHHFVIIVGRALTGMIAMTVVYYLPQFISLAKLGILNQLTPVFATLFSMLILREYPTFLQALLSVVAILGSVCVMQPSFMFEKNVQAFDLSLDWEALAMLLLLIGVAAEGLASVLNRKAGITNVPCTVILWANSAISTPVVIMLYTAVNIKHIDSSWLFFSNLKSCTVFGSLSLVIICLLGFINQTMILYANKCEKSSIVAVISACCKVVFFFISDFIFFFEEMNYNFLHYLGGCLIGGSILGLLVSNHLKQLSLNTCKEDSSVLN